jgi:hypothetical protein
LHTLQNLLGEGHFLDVKLAVSERAEVKQIKDVDLDQLKGTYVLEGVEELSLLTTKVSP